MRRSLVLTSEAARHAFRASLPPHVTGGQDADVEARAVTWRERIGLGADDLRSFLVAYSACLVAVTTFLA